MEVGREETQVEVKTPVVEVPGVEKVHARTGQGKAMTDVKQSARIAGS